MLGVFAFPTLVPEFARAWSLSNTEVGWISGIYFAAYTLAVPVLASLSDRVDGRVIYVLSAIVGGLASVGFAVYAQGFWSALAFRVLGGLGLAGTFLPGLNALVSRLEGRAQARAVAFYTATFSLGTSLSFLTTGEIALRFGWRWAFTAAAFGSLLALIIAGTALGPAPAKRPRVGPRTHLLDFRPVFRNRQAMAYVLAYAAHMWELFGLRSWLVAFLAFSLTLQPAGESYLSPANVAALTGLVAMWSSVAGAELAMRFGRDRVLCLIMGSSAVFACVIGFSAALPYPLVAVLCVLYALFVQGDSAALHTGLVQTADPELRGAAMAVQSLIGFASAFIGPLVVGVVLDVSGGGRTVASWGAAFIAMGLVVALGPLVIWRFGRRIAAAANNQIES